MLFDKDSIKIGPLISFYEPPPLKKISDTSVYLFIYYLPSCGKTGHSTIQQSKPLKTEATPNHGPQVTETNIEKKI